MRGKRKLGGGLGVGEKGLVDISPWCWYPFNNRDSSCGTSPFAGDPGSFIRAAGRVPGKDVGFLLRRAVVVVDEPQSQGQSPAEEKLLSSVGPPRGRRKTEKPGR